MGKKLFRVEINTTITLELDDTVIQVVDDEWRKHLYELHTPEGIARMIAFNMVVNDATLSQMDGWADQPDEHARIIGGIGWLCHAKQL